ncbi:MAG: M48 family metalloprotease [Alphaproteobacteria bacterium]|nr:M48 family metalloprotease [Alphaproteobacteria bacterium]
MEKTYQRLVIKLIGSILLPITLFMSFDTHAQNIRLISDEETEQLIADIAKPLFASANIPFNRNELHIVEDDSLNAFVADGNNLFIHTGTILAADNVDELVGVIAHETGHIAGGHILR